MNIDTTLISPRMLEAGVTAARQFLEGGPDERCAELAAAIYTAMHAKHVDSLDG